MDKKIKKLVKLVQQLNKLMIEIIGLIGCFKGHLYQGDYEPLISEKDWRHAQRIVQKIRCGRRKYIR